MWEGVLIIVHIHLVNLSPIFSLHLLCGSQTMIPFEVILPLLFLGVFFQISFDNLRFQVASFNILSFSMFLCKFYYCTLFCVCVCVPFYVVGLDSCILQMSYISFGNNAPFKFIFCHLFLMWVDNDNCRDQHDNNAWQTSYGGGCDELQHIFAQIDTLLLKLAQEPNHGTSLFYYIFDQNSNYTQ